MQKECLRLLVNFSSQFMSLGGKGKYERRLGKLVIAIIYLAALGKLWRAHTSTKRSAPCRVCALIADISE